MAQHDWEADKMLDVYIYDYLVKRNLQATAKAFATEGKVSTEPVAIEAPKGFLYEWWSVFWDIYIARSNEKHSEAAAAYLEVQQLKARELQMQKLQLMQRHAHLQRRDATHAALNGSAMDSEVSPPLLDAGRMTLLNSATTHPGQLVQSNAGSISSALQQIQARNRQTTDIKPDLGLAQRSLPMDLSSLYGQGTGQAKSGLGSAGLNQGVRGHPLRGWPLNVPKPFISSTNQFQILTPQQQQQLLAQAQAHGNLGNAQQRQQLLAHAQGHGNLGNSQSYGEIDPRRLQSLGSGGLNGKDGQPTGNDGSIGSPSQSSSLMAGQDQAEYLMKLKVAQMQQHSAQLPQEQLLQQQQLQQNSRKRRATSSGAANSSGTGNTVGPSSPPSTPSTHTPGDGVAVTGNLSHVSSMPKGLMMYGTDGTGRLATSSNQMDDLEHFGDVGSLDDNVESFLSHDDGDARDVFAALKKSPKEHNSESSKGFTFGQCASNCESNNKLVCCHFSSDGKWLAAAGHQKKIILWNQDNFLTEFTPEEHTLIITDIRFRPDSDQLATSSFDRTVRLWNAAGPSLPSVHTFTGHSSQVTSLDFHPKNTEIISSCDRNGEIRLWNVSQYSCSRVSKGGSAQVRFQPSIGQFLAAAADNVVSIFDVETNRPTRQLQGHNKEVHSLCWDATGEYIASVSQDCVKVWSLTSGNCIHELSSNGNKFHSCVFHPTYSSLLVVGGYQSLQLWNMVEKQTMIVRAHDGLIAALAQSTVRGTIGSASHDKTMKLWK